MTQEQQKEMPLLEKQVAWFYERLEAQAARLNLAPLCEVLNRMLLEEYKGSLNLEGGLKSQYRFTTTSLQMKPISPGENANDLAERAREAKEKTDAFIKAITAYRTKKDLEKGIHYKVSPEDLLKLFLKDVSEEFTRHRDAVYKDSEQCLDLQNPLVGYDPVSGKVVPATSAPAPGAPAPAPDVNRISQVGTIAAPPQHGQAVA